MPARDVRYRAIADDLRQRLAGGDPPAGRLLPSEADLSAAYGASRVTVRRALEELRADGLVESRQGLGWSVAGLLPQTLGRLATIEAQLAALGVVAERRVLDFGLVRASGPARAALGAGPVLRVRRLNLADGEPFARVTVWVPEPLARGLGRTDVERTPLYELLPVRLASATQTVAADGAAAADARLLGVEQGSPVLHCRRVTYDDRGDAVIVSEHVFPAGRTELVIELTGADDSLAPSGLQLVR